MKQERAGTCVNDTMRKFGYPDSTVKEFKNWIILLRPQQLTLGSMVLVCKESATTFSAVSTEAFAELQQVTRQVERGLQDAFTYDKINYLMLMMVDPHVHFHIVPRYDQERTFEGQKFYDYAWPGPPDFSRGNQTKDETNRAILAHLKAFY
ncbi:MAG TPA: HIT family protein [Nitrospiraceae bacterium]|nr:HIT family protein [Nitrospiraceae bacterium]